MCCAVGCTALTVISEIMSSRGSSVIAPSPSPLLVEGSWSINDRFPSMPWTHVPRHFSGYDIRSPVQYPLDGSTTGGTHRADLILIYLMLWVVRGGWNQLPWCFEVYFSICTGLSRSCLLNEIFATRLFLPACFPGGICTIRASCTNISWRQR